MSTKKYRDSHREETREYNKKYRETHEDYFAQYRETNKDKIKSYWKTDRHSFNRSKSACKRRNKEWGLTLDEYKLAIDKPCHYCDGFFGKVEYSIGLDRIDSAKGYMVDNVVSCCYVCNRVKGDMFTVEETKAAVQAVMVLRKREM